MNRVHITALNDPTAPATERKAIVLDSKDSIHSEESDSLCLQDESSEPIRPEMYKNTTTYTENSMMSPHRFNRHRML